MNKSIGVFSTFYWTASQTAMLCATVNNGNKIVILLPFLPHHVDEGVETPFNRVETYSAIIERRTGGRLRAGR